MTPKRAKNLLGQTWRQYLTIPERQNIAALIEQLEAENRRLRADNKAYRRVVMNAAERYGDQDEPVEVKV